MMLMRSLKTCKNEVNDVTGDVEKDVNEIKDNLEKRNR